jgi:hypothetical protein
MDGLLALSLRPFGRQPADLDLDLRQAPRPQLVTALLVSCSGLPLDQVWGLAVSRRVLLLMALASGQGSYPVEVFLHCSQGGCGEHMSLEFSLAELADVQQRAEIRSSAELQAGDDRLSLRRPTGNDQRAWQAAVRSGEEALTLMLASLVTPPSGLTVELSPGLVAQIDAAMQDFDPLVHFNVQVQCPACGTEHQQPVDLQEIALAYLQATQRDLIEQVHRLARHYHWSEVEILALPSWRRRRYVSLLQKDGLL